MITIPPSEIAINRAQGLNFLKTRLIEQQKNYLSTSTAYSASYYVYFFSTTVLICITSILSFLVSSEVFSTSTDQWLSLVAGILSIIATTIHSFYNGLSLQAKAYAFKQTSLSFSSLAESLILDTGPPSFTGAAERECFSCAVSAHPLRHMPSSDGGNGLTRLGYRFFLAGQVSAADYDSHVAYFKNEETKIKLSNQFPPPCWFVKNQAIEC